MLCRWTRQDNTDNRTHRRPRADEDLASEECDPIDGVIADF